MTSQSASVTIMEERAISAARASHSDRMLMSPAQTAMSTTLPVNELAQALDPPSARDRFAELLAAHWDRAYRFAHHLTGNVADSDDLIQQAAEEAFRGFHRFQPGTHFDRWFFRIIHNTFVDRVRKDRRRRIFSLDEVTGPAAAEIADPGTTVEGVLDGPVLRALRALPPDARAVVALVDLEALSYEETAEILHCPIGTVRSRLHRARLALREWLRPYVDAIKRGDL